jgi:UDP-N-acetylmuramyl pentapeptide phosphotransferase/UDP-N-acetylglucosamine-1-phosphate transferase
MTAGALCLIVVASAVISAGLIVVLLPLLRRHTIAHVNARSSHREPTPQGGGAAVIIAALGVSAVALAGFQLAPVDLKSLSLVLGAAALLAVVGFADDSRDIGVVPRFVLQICAVAMVLMAVPSELRIVPALPWWLERALLLLGCLWLVNLTNFMDGIDWITVSEVVPVTTALAVLGFMGAMPAYGVVVALALAGAMLGFAPFNKPVAKLFLGDVGSLPIGLLLGWLLILLAGNGHIAAALLIPLYYVADATITLFRRLMNGERVWEGHRSHFYQRAAAGGFKVIEIVTRVFAVNVVLALLAFATVQWPSPAISVGALVAGAALVGVLLTSFSRGRS